MTSLSIAVIGAGQMGAGIAQTAATAGHTVCLIDASIEAAARGQAAILKQLSRLQSKGKIDAATESAIASRIRTASELSAAREADFAIEAVSEKPELKQKIFVELDQVMKPSAIIASNTSSISITAMAAMTQRPAQIIGMHFMNPVPIMQLVEIIRALQTSDATYSATRALAEQMNKITVLSKEAPGFIVNRILMPMINEAVFALDEGLASAQDIDTAMKLGTNQPMGPLTLADFIGLDTVLSILEVLHRELGEDKYRPSPLLRRYVAAGWLGKKVGRGFYTYE